MLKEIINPNKVDNLEDYCEEINCKVNLCYGYKQDYYPMTCSYAKDKLNNTKAR